MSINLPIVNAPNMYVDGLELAWASATTLTVAAGQARNSTNENDILLAAPVTINAAVSGQINGLDQGALGNSLWYGVYAVADSTLNLPTGAVLSLDVDGPLLPGGYDMWRRIGWVLTDGAAALLKFWQYGNDKERDYWWDVKIQELNAGNATAFTAIDLATSVPPIATEVLFAAVFTPDGATEIAEFIPFGSTATNGIVTFGYGVAAAQQGMVWVPAEVDAGVPKVQYKVAAGDTLTLNTAGWKDYL